MASPGFVARGKSWKLCRGALTADFCLINTKRSVPWPSKYAKIRFRPGLCPEHTPLRELTSHNAPPEPSRLGRGQPSPYSALGTNPPSAPDLCIWLLHASCLILHSAQCTVAQTCQLCCSILHLVNIR